MKKLWLVVALAALGGLASNTFADVQNIRLSGDIRIRAYFLDSAGVSAASAPDQLDANTSFISQRTRVSVEADLEDHVLVVVTLKAEGTWGSSDQTFGNSGAGFSNAGVINRGFGVGIDEAYVQLNEMFFSPATVKVGRQYLNYGHGLILSSAEQEYNYDAARMVLDFYPVTIDLVGAQVVRNQSFGATPNSNSAFLPTGSDNLLFLNARYEMTDSILKNIEAYAGWQSKSRLPGATPGTGLGSPDAVSPWIVGLRTDLQPTDGFQIWLEGTYEASLDGNNASTGNPVISAFLANAGFRYTAKKCNWAPSINGNYIYASGGGGAGGGNFIPWFGYGDGYNGYLLAPRLSNIHIFNLGTSIKPSENTSLSFQGYYYMRADNDNSGGFANPSDPNVDFGGLAFAAGGSSGGLGWEIDSIFGYDYSKDLRLQLVYAAFIPGGAFQNGAPGTGDGDRTAQEVRGEIAVKF
jgi:hypothetical protein